MKIAVLTANLGNFDTNVENLPQIIPDGYSMTFHRFTDENFPPCVGLTPRMQYRIPKLFGYEDFPGYDYYIWLDGSFTFQHPDSLKYFIDRIGESEMLFFKHPWRDTVKEEVDHIEEKLQKNDKYITPRYKGGFHKEQYTLMMQDPGFNDNLLLTSTAFMYKNTPKAREALKMWWYYGSRYFTCDQIVLPYVLFQTGVNYSYILENQYKIPYLTLTSTHK